MTGLSKKREREVERVIDGAQLEMLDKYVPDILDNPPEIWNNEDKATFDLITDVEMTISRKLKVLFDKWAGRATLQP